jgi:hypothetical protein
MLHGGDVTRNVKSVNLWKNSLQEGIMLLAFAYMHCATLREGAGGGEPPLCYCGKRLLWMFQAN